MTAQRMSGRNRETVATVYRLVMLSTRLALVTAVLAACGCGGDTGQQSADCTQQIEHRGVRYTEGGFTGVEPLEFKRVVAVPCVDTGVEPESDAPPEYRTAFRFTDHDPREVLAVMAGDGLYRVMLADMLSNHRASFILKSVGAD